jgi:low temperature requirement protein LtrA
MRASATERAEHVTGAAPAEREEVSPLELFFDLVFVFAVSQLSRHLLDHLTWRGAAETLIVLIAVFDVWSGTSFEAPLLQVGRSQSRWMLIAVMLVGLFMNAAIGHAFDVGGADFVIPLLLIQSGRPILTIVTAPDRRLREHYARLLSWIVATAPLWIAGAISAPASRLFWWAGAAAIDLVGTWLAHPLPGRVLRSEHVAFDADHMLERCRLFLLIALGESVVTTGTAIANAPRSLMTILTGACALIAIIALWTLHFGVSDHFLNRYVAATTDPLFAARRTVNGLLIVVAGLIALAVGNELVIAHPHGHTAVSLVLLLFGGPLLYLFSQTWYLWAVMGVRSVQRCVGMAALVVAGSLSLWLPPFASIALLAPLLALLVATFLRGERRASSQERAHVRE